MVITITIIALVLILLTLTKILKEVSSINNTVANRNSITDFYSRMINIFEKYTVNSNADHYDNDDGAVEGNLKAKAHLRIVETY